jgi:hypothetical protein
MTSREPNHEAAEKMRALLIEGLSKAERVQVLTDAAMRTAERVMLRPNPGSPWTEAEAAVNDIVSRTLLEFMFEIPGFELESLYRSEAEKFINELGTVDEIGD